VYHFGFRLLVKIFRTDFNLKVVIFLGEVYFCSVMFTEGDPIRLYDENGTIAEAPSSTRKSQK